MELPQDLNRYRAESEGGFFSVFRDAFHVVLGVGAVLLLLFVALGWQ